MKNWTKEELAAELKSNNEWFGGNKTRAFHSEMNGDGSGNLYKIEGEIGIVNTTNNPELVEVINEFCDVRWERF
jgi:hypothetical protein